MGTDVPDCIAIIEKYFLQVNGHGGVNFRIPTGPRFNSYWAKFIPSSTAGCSRAILGLIMSWAIVWIDETCSVNSLEKNHLL